VYGEGPTKIVTGQFHDTDTKPYTAQDFRFTTKGGMIYATELGWPADGTAVIQSMGTGAGKVAKVELLGSTEAVGFEQAGTGLTLHLPAKAPTAYASCFRITLIK
jgi:alpha-L-fucosidase